MRKLISHFRIATLAVMAAASVVALVGGCKGGAEGKPAVVATTTMIGDLVKRIAGDRFVVQVIMGPGTDPHTFKARPEHMAQLNAAKAIFYNGLHLEGTMVDLFENTLKDRSVAITSTMNHNDELLPWEEGSGGVHDPHVWFNAELWAKAAGTVRDKLIAIDPANADEYRKRTDELTASLKALHQEVKQKIATLPPERRVLVTSHDAYNYFGKAYGVRVVGLQGISTETEAGINDVKNVAKLIHDEKVPAIFVESSVNPKNLERVQAEAKQIYGWDVKIGGELYSDAMGAAGEHPPYPVETYEGMMRYNVDTIVNAMK